MNDRDRLDQLRRLLDRLERMPAASDRDWMLAEVRGRAVDVETGIAPAPMHAPPQAEIAAARSPRPAPVKPHRRKPTRRAQRATLGRRSPLTSADTRRSWTCSSRAA
jgi:hypothetical protein